MQLWFVRRSIGVAGMLLLTACIQQPLAPLSPAVDLAWPAAPATARIRFLYALSEPADINIRKGWLARLAGALRGGQERSIHSPYGIAKDAEGPLYVVDNYYQMVHVFDLKKHEYYRFPKQELDGFENPIDIALGTGGRIYVSDSVAGRVHVFAKSGKKYLRSIGEGQLHRPTGIAVNHQTGELLVLDTQASLLFAYDETDLTLTRTVGGNSDQRRGAPRFHYPTNITVAGDGAVYVCDSLNFRVQALNADLQVINSFGAPGDTPGSFSRPKGIATDSDGNVYVIDSLFDNVQIFDEHGELLLAFGGPGSALGKFWLPNAIHIDSSDRIYVSDSYNKRVQVFQYVKEGSNQA